MGWRRWRAARRCGALVCGALLGAGALTACGGGAGTGGGREAGGTAAHLVAVRVEGDARSITLRGVPGRTTASVHTVLGAGGPPRGRTWHVERGVLVLGGCGPGCAVSYRVDLPAGLPVTGTTSARSVVMSGMGDVAVDSGSGSLTSS